MIDRTNIANLSGAEVIDMNGKKVGKVGQVYVDEQDGTPNWLTVNTGLFGMSETFVPIDRATWDGEAVTVPYEKDFTKDAPRIDGDGRISPAEEEQLYRYYGMSDSTAPTGTAPTGTAPTGTAPTGHDASGPDTDTDTDTTVTRSEEQLTVGTEQVETGKARLRKYVVTEEQNVTVPVAHEEVHLEREPISEQNAGRGTSGADIGEEDVEVTLHAERPVVDKETVAVEQVRVDVETVTDQERVSEEVRKERVELDDGTSTERPST